MTAKSDYFEEVVLNILRGTDVTAPTSIYVSLHGSASNTDAPGTELTGAGYARMAVTLSAPVVETGQTSLNVTGFEVSNTAPLEWTNLPGGTIATIGLWDAVTAGNLYYWGDFTGGARTVLSGDSFSIATGDLKIVER